MTLHAGKLYGIQIAVVFGGSLGKFGFVQLLIALTTALSLLASYFTAALESNTLCSPHPHQREPSAAGKKAL